MMIKEMPKSERPREKLRARGKESLSDSELLAILLRSGTKSKTALDLAAELLAQNEDGLVALEDMRVEELSQREGIGEAKAATVLAALELGKRLATGPRRDRAYFHKTEDAALYFMEQMRYYKQEVFNILMVDTKGGLIAQERISMGDISSSIVHPREVYRDAIRRGAYGVIFAHNHPSGDPTPSREDIETTDRLSKAGDILGIRVLDHVIIGDGRFTSLRAEGIIK